MLVEYQLRSFLPWLASISLDVAVGGVVVQDPAQVIFIISKNPFSTKPTVILNFSTPSLFLLWPTVRLIDLKHHIDYFSKGPKSSWADHTQKRRSFQANSNLSFHHNEISMKCNMSGS